MALPIEETKARTGKSMAAVAGCSAQVQGKEKEKEESGHETKEGNKKMPFIHGVKTK